jgi:hypothetical protein
MANWHPASTAERSEWELRPSATENPYALIRRIQTRDSHGPQAEVWFRVVTWASRSEDRELIGWRRTLEAAAAWDFNLAASSLQHSIGAVRGHGTPGNVPKRPAPPDLLRAYRHNVAARAAHSTSRPQNTRGNGAHS